MITINDITKNTECDFCQKTKNCCIVRFSDQSAGESVLCWKCLEAQAEMKARSRQPRQKPAEPESKPLAARSGPSNGEAVSAVPVKPQ